MTETPPIRDATTRRQGPPWAVGGPTPPTAPPTTPRHLARVALGAAAVTAASLGVVVGAGVVPLGHGVAGGASLATGPVPDLPPSATASSSVSEATATTGPGRDPATDLGPTTLLDEPDPTAPRPSTTLPRLAPSVPLAPPAPLPPVSGEPDPVDPPSSDQPEPTPDDPTPADPTPDDPGPTPDQPEPTPGGPGDDDGAGGPPSGGPTDPAGSSVPSASSGPPGLAAPQRVSASG